LTTGRLLAINSLLMTSKWALITFLIYNHGLTVHNTSVHFTPESIFPFQLTSLTSLIFQPLLSICQCLHCAYKYFTQKCHITKV